LEDAQARNHKLTHSLKIKEEKITSLEERLVLKLVCSFFASKHSLIILTRVKTSSKFSNFFIFFHSVETLDELLSETKKLNQAVQLKDEKIKALENK